MDQELTGLQDEAGREPEFFISRAGPDAALAQRIAHILEDAGRRVVIQDWDFKNRAFMERMHAALTSGARTVALLSPDYLTRDHCAAEWQNTIADDPLNRQSKLIVLRIRPCDPVGLLKSLAFWDLVPLLSAPEQDGLLRDAVLASVRTGRQKDPLSRITRFFAAAKPILHAEIKPYRELHRPRRRARRHRRRARTRLRHRHHPARRGARPRRHRQIHARARIRRAAAAEAGHYAGVWWLRAEKAKDSDTWDGIEQGLADLRAVLFPGLEPPKERAKAARGTLNFLSSRRLRKALAARLRQCGRRGGAGCLGAARQRAGADDLPARPLGRARLRRSRSRNGSWTRRSAICARRAGGRILAPPRSRHREKLGRLPLALSHAAAYLKRNAAVTADDYLSELSRRMKEAPKGVAYKASVFATFQLAMEQAEAKAPGAAAVLTLAAFFAPENIPEELFTQAAEIYPPALQPLAANLPRLREAIGALDQLSLADFDPGSRGFSVHRLVQAAARDALRNRAPARQAFSLAKLLRRTPKAHTGGNPEAEWIAAAVKACAAAYPGADFEHWPAYERLFRMLRLAESGDAASPWQRSIRLATTHDPPPMRSRAAFERALAIWRRRSARITPMSPIAEQPCRSHAQGAYAHAEPLFERALAIGEKALGPDHPDVATSLNNLAELYRAQGAYARAEPLYERALAIWEKALGPDHPRCRRLAEQPRRALSRPGRLCASPAAF